MAPRVPQAKLDEIAARRAQVAAFRLSHFTQRQIAARLGVSVGTINEDLRAIRDEWQARRATHYDDWVGEELAKLDRLEQSLMGMALQGQHQATDRILSIMDRRARLIGLDRPQLHEHTVITRDALDAEIERLEGELRAREREQAAADETV